jgi:hypothetical protein
MDSARHVASALRVRFTAYTTLKMPQKRGFKRFDARMKSFGRRFERLRMQGFLLWQIKMVASVGRLEVHCVFPVLKPWRVSLCHVKGEKALMTTKSLRRCSKRCIKEMIQRAFFCWRAFV